MKMVLAGYEWIVVGIIVVAIFVWGPNKIPEIARGLGRARREFDEASKGLTTLNMSPRSDSSVADPLVDTAQKLGISTTGRTRQEISDEIVRKAQTKN